MSFHRPVDTLEHEIHENVYGWLDDTPSRNVLNSLVIITCDHCIWFCLPRKAPHVPALPQIFPKHIHLGNHFTFGLYPGYRSPAGPVHKWDSALPRCFPLPKGFPLLSRPKPAGFTIFNLPGGNLHAQSGERYHHNPTGSPLNRHRLPRRASTMCNTPPATQRGLSTSPSVLTRRVVPLKRTPGNASQQARAPSRAPVKRHSARQTSRESSNTKRRLSAGDYHRAHSSLQYAGVLPQRTLQEGPDRHRQTPTRGAASRPTLNRPTGSR